MAKGQQDLKLTSKAEGFDETAKKVDQVADSTAKLKGQVDRGGKAATDAAKSQEKLNASESDYVSLLAAVSPRLSLFVDSLLKGSKIAGDFASQQIDVAALTGKATEAIKKNAAALKLIGAAGAVALAIYAIVKAIETMRQEAEAATKAITAQSAALSELQRQGQERGQAIENISDTRRRGGFTADQARSAVNVARLIGERYEFLSPDAVNQVVGLAGDARLSTAQLARAAFLQQSGRLDLNPDATASGMRRKILNTLRRYSEQIAPAFARETAQGQRLGVSGERAQAARQELDQVGGSTVALEDIARQFAPAGVDAGRIARIANQLRDSELSRRSQQIVATGGPLEFPGLAESERTVSAYEVTIAQDLVDRILRAANRQVSSGPGGGTTITINDNTVTQHNVRNIGVGVRGRRRRTRRELIE